MSAITWAKDALTVTAMVDEYRVFSGPLARQAAEAFAAAVAKQRPGIYPIGRSDHSYVVDLSGWPARLAYSDEVWAAIDSHCTRAG